MRNPFRARGKGAAEEVAGSPKGPAAKGAAAPAEDEESAREARRREREARRRERTAKAEERGPGAKALRRGPARKPRKGRGTAKGRTGNGREALRARAAGARRASAEGLRATAGRAGTLAPHARRLGDWVALVLRRALALVFRAAGLVEKTLRIAISGARRGLAAAIARLDRWITPQRGAFALVCAAAACLAVSQFGDYRGVEVGQPGYADVEAIAEPPQRAEETPVDAHSYALLALAAIAVGLGLAALLRRRPGPGRAIALCGVAALAVILAIDMPRGLDEGDAAVQYEGAKATLNEPFYAEAAAAAGLVLAGLVLSLNLRRESGPARRPRRVRRGRRRRAGESPSLAGSGS